MAMAKSSHLRFGFTTRDMTPVKGNKFFLTHDRGKLVVGSVTEDDNSESGNLSNVPSLIEQSTTSSKSSGLNSTATSDDATQTLKPGVPGRGIILSTIASKSEGLETVTASKDVTEKIKSVYSHTGDILSVNSCLQTQVPSSQASQRKAELVEINPPSLVREKTISIPKSHLLEGLESMVINKPWFKSSWEGDDNETLLSARLSETEYIRTMYHECEGDRDAMRVSLETIEKPHVKTSWEVNHPGKTNSDRLGWTKKIPKTDTSIRITGTSGMLYEGKTEGGVSRSLAERPESPKRLPQTDSQKVPQNSVADSGVSSSSGNGLLRKSWRLAFSRASTFEPDPSDVFVTGTNIHPVCQDSIANSKKTSTLEHEAKRTSRNKGVELLKFSFPVFQSNSNRNPPLLTWHEHQQMIALGRPKSVNERSPRKLTRKVPAASKNLQYKTSNSNTAPGREISTTEILNGKYVNGVQLSLHSAEDRIMTSEQANLRTPPTNVKTTEINIPDDYRWGNMDEDSSDAVQADEIEPALKPSNLVPRMQGPTSNILDSSFQSDTSIYKREKGARFRLCKPMFDKEDYEDFQHKKFKKYSNKYKRDHDPDEGVHYLRVKIGEFT